MDRGPGNVARLAAIPRFVESYATNPRKEIDPIGCASKLDDVIRPQEIVLRDAGGAKPEGLQDIHEFISVFLISCHENIQIARVTGPAVECQCPRTHDHVFNTLRVQQADEFAQIVR